jgi:hypothetical protein
MRGRPSFAKLAPQEFWLGAPRPTEEKFGQYSFDNDILKKSLIKGL